MNDIKKILVSTDFSEHSKKVLQSAIMIARKFDAAIDVVFVVASLDAYADFVVQPMPLEKLEKDLHDRASRKMTEFIEENMAKDIPHASVVLNGNVPQEIVSHAKTVGYDLIMIGTNDCKNVTERVIKTAQCSVLSMQSCIQG